MKTIRAWAVAFCTLLLSFAAGAAGLLGPAALLARHAALAPQLASNPFGGPLVLQSEELPRRIEGDVYAVLEHPFTAVSAALADPSQWCEILILHLNTKYCRRVEAQEGTRLQVRVGRKEPQPVQAASLLDFGWRPPQARADYLAVQMDAPEGPYDTGDYRLLAEAVPLPGGRSFLHLGYGLGYGGASRLALQLYLTTLGRDKVGFTRVRRGGQEAFVDGVRGVVERNTMRYYLAIDAYLDSLSAPPGRQLEQRLQAWFDATERYPRQLHEVEREAYLRMKRDEVRRQAATR
ncbi:MAG TPA: hypothetical protein VFM98_13990 [Ramlibacter sp.]|uniref:hypothetical protein n=1 Tax=Ramlibacter sp. TaxID=1917967 RepID=UPI002D7E4703|nr:hypothetical protein [Ramlibacter sp.]HET8746713.1 hypothetical protein [Ramlibacter sp.]